MTSLSKTALSQRFKGVSWYLFRGVYNHLLSKYKAVLPATELQLLGRFKDIFAIDGSVIGLVLFVWAYSILDRGDKVPMPLGLFLFAPPLTLLLIGVIFWILEWLVTSLERLRG